MNEEWLYLVKKYTEAGARTKFEDICASLFKKKHLPEVVKTVKVSAGDGGIDIFIGEFIEPIHVIQCKFFVNGIEASQKEQIRTSFKTAIESNQYKCKNWTLCIPDRLSLKEHGWWSGWKQKQIEEYALSASHISLIDGADLIDELKKFDLYNAAFDENSKKYIQELYEASVKDSFNLEAELQSASTYLSNLKNHFAKEESTHICRKQTDEIVSWVNADLPGKDISEKILIIQGKKGVGKSTILKDVYNELQKDDNHLILALKCDQIYDTNLNDLVRQIFVNISNFSQLVNAVQLTGKKFVVILDQLDALSQTLSTERRYIKTYIKLIAELNVYKDVRIIISTRDFDLEYDADLRILNDNSSVKQIEVSNLAKEDVTKVLKLLRIDAKSKVLIELLCIPYNLELFTKIPDLKDLLRKETRISLSKLYSELWSQVLVRKELRIAECLDAIVKRMYEMHPNLVEQSFLEKFSLEIDYLASYGILLKNGNKLSFFHQSFYEYYLARWFVTSEKDLIEYIFDTDQNLYIRSLIKTVIEYLRETDHPKYIALYNNVLKNKGIRYHIKYLLIVELGSIEIPSQKERELALEILCDEYSALFLDTFDSPGWLRFFIENDLLKGSENEIYRILFRNLNHGPELVLVYLEKGSLNTSETLISALIPSISNWNAKLVEYLETYYTYNQDRQLWYFEILKKIAPFDLSFVLNKLGAVILTELPRKERIKFDYRFDRIIDFLYELNPKDTSIFLLTIHLQVLQSTSYPYYSNYEAISSSLLSSHQYDNRFFYKDSSDETSLDSYLIKYYSECEREEFKLFINTYKYTDFVPLIILLTKLLRIRAEEFITEIVELVLIIDSKNGFKGRDDFFSLNLRRLISKSIIYFNPQQYSKLKEVLFRISHPYEIHKQNYLGKKSYHLSIGKKKFLFVKALPKEILQKDKDLLRLCQEMTRRFGDLDYNIALDRGGSRSGPVGAPLSNANYEKFNEQSWLKSMRKIDENYKSDDFFKGGLLEHARVFEEITSKKPDRLYTLLDKLFLEKEISWKYISHGISGLIKAKYDAVRVRELIKKEIELPLDSGYTTQATWHIRYLFDTENISDKMVLFLISVAKSDKFKNDEFNSEDPLSDFINTPRGSALYNLMHLAEQSKYEEMIFSTVEYVIDPSRAPSNTIACGVMAELGHLNKLDIERSFEIFKTLVSLDRPLILKHSLNTAQYFNNVFHKRMEFYFKEVLKHEELFEHAYFFVTSWIFKGIDNYEMYNDFIKRGENAIKCAIEVAESFLIHKGQVNERALQVLERALMFSEVNISRELSGLVLRKFVPEHFSLLYSFIDKYVETDHFIQDPAYLLDFLTSCTSNHPVECLKLLGKMRIPEKVDISRTFYKGDELLTLVLSIYSRLRNESYKFRAEQTVALNAFDKMLKIPTIRYKAVQAMEKVLN